MTSIDAAATAGAPPLPGQALRLGLRTVLRGLPGPVAVVTTSSPGTREPAGLAASAVVPVSLDPPSMLVCINRTASAHAVIEQARRFCIVLIGPSETGLVARFSTSSERARRFSDGNWAWRHDLPFLAGAPASLFCDVRTTLLFGTHEAFVGEVFDIETSSLESPVAWIDGAFARCVPLHDAPRSAETAYRKPNP